ncbi:uncharacterized protein [Diabrotica undecimpunctata]|uniref:uncharacterized protein n=1 Tax=Diabrotica undecimpunctata TaxID=50387 RepID=UPI003B63D889
MDSGNFIEEIIVLPPTPNAGDHDYTTASTAGWTRDDREYTNVQWSNNATKILIDLYKKYRESVGTLEMKSLKKMWQVISSEFTSMGLNYSGLNCENRFKVLERNYKKFVDNQNKTGRGRRVFEYFEEMNELYGNKKSVFPKILLTATQKIVPVSLNSEPGPTTIKPPEPAISQPESTSISVENVRATKPKKSLGSKKSRKMTAMEGIREDLRGYRRRKLFLLKKRYDQRNKYEQDKITAINAQTAVLKEIADKLPGSGSSIESIK